MKKLYCDICGKQIIPVPIKVTDIRKCDYSVYRNDKYGKHLLDLCDKCSINLSKLIINQEEKKIKTKETLKKAELLNENIYYINNLLYAIKDNAVVFSSTVTGKDYRLNDLDSCTRDLIIEAMKQILNRRRDEMLKMLENL